MRLSLLVCLQINNGRYSSCCHMSGGRFIEKFSKLNFNLIHMWIGGSKRVDILLNGEADTVDEDYIGCGLLRNPF